jgi:hypothetical protein
MVRPDPLAEFIAACTIERAAWDRVKDHLPGTATFDRVGWDEWRNAVRDSDAARRALSERTTKPPPRKLI